MIQRLLVLSAFLYSSALLAFPLAKGPRPLFSPLAVTDSYDYEGIVALNNCSGSLVQFEGQSPNSPAYVFTNGHCLEGGYVRPGQYVYGRQSMRRFSLLNHNASDAGRVQATLVVYATMTGTDLTIYRLRETYTEIEQRFQIRPLLVAKDHPTAQTPIEILSGYWRRGYACSIDGFVFTLREGGWESHDSIRYTNPGCEVIGGTSGSPILARGTRTVVGINNTGNEDGGRCTENNPCEINESGEVFYQQGLSYGQQTYQVYTCLTANFEIDLSVPGCQLFH